MSGDYRYEYVRVDGYPYFITKKNIRRKDANRTVTVKAPDGWRCDIDFNNNAEADGCFDEIVELANSGRYLHTDT